MGKSGCCREKNPQLGQAPKQRHHPASDKVSKLQPWGLLHHPLALRWAPRPPFPFVEPSVRITSSARHAAATCQLGTMPVPQHTIVLPADYTGRAVCLAWYYYVSRTFLSPGRRKRCHLLTKKPRANPLPAGAFSRTLLLFLESANGLLRHKSTRGSGEERGEASIMVNP